MKLEWVPVREWTQMSDAEQRAAIRAGVAPPEDLPDHFRRLVDEMVANARPLAT